MDNKLTKIVISITVIVIVLATVLIPILNDATKTHDTLDNTTDSICYMTAITATSNYTLSWDPSDDPAIITVNGDNLDFESVTTVCSNGDWLIRASKVGSNYGLRGFGLTSTLRVSSDSTSDDYAKLDVTIASGTITCKKTLLSAAATETTVTDTITSGFAVTKTGAYVMKATTQSAYVLDDTTITAMGITTLDGVSTNMFYITGTVDDLEVSQILPSPATYTISNIDSDAAVVSAYKDTYTIKEITFTATQIEDTTKVTECTYNYFIVPATVSAELSSHLNDGESAIFNVIPVVLIAAILMMVAAVILGRKE